MSWKNLDGILTQIKQDPSWEKYQQYSQLLHEWHQIVPASARNNTRPLYISRKILWVATSSAAWAQTLFMQRQQFLKVLNAKWSAPIKDIRFSAAHWQQKNLNTQSNTDHPSHLPAALLTSFSAQPLPKPASPEQVFQNWVESYQKRTKTWPLCPQCQSPSPPGEIQRWQVRPD